MVVVCRHAVAIMGAWRPSGGYLPVDLFFVLSGFVISHAYDARLRSGMTPAGFLLRRVIRLYPLYALGLMVALCAALGGFILHNGPKWPSMPSILLSGGLAAAGLPVPTAVSHSGLLFPMNSAFWSLLFEFFANLVFVATFPFLNEWRLKVVVFVSGVTLLVASAFHGNIDMGASWSDALLGVPRVIFSFFVGVAICRAKPALAIRGANFLRNLPQSAIISAILALLLATFFAPVPDGLRGVFDGMVVVGVFPFVVALGACVEPGSWFRGSFQFLGKTSYAVYVLHIPMLYGFDIVCHKLGLGIEAYAPAFIILFAPIALCASWFVDVLYDLPVRDVLTRRLVRGSSAPSLKPVVKQAG